MNDDEPLIVDREPDYSNENNPHPTDVKVEVKISFTIPYIDDFIKNENNYTPNAICRMIENAVYDCGMENIIVTPIKIEKYYD